MAEYKKYASQFNPVKYDPEAWVKLAKEAGMKYIVITSKHHDGFALFDSKVTDWDAVDATPYGKDLLKPLAKACKKEGMKLGFYYSQAQDWNHPGGAATRGHWDEAQKGSMDEYIDKIAVPQVKEILSKYGDIAILWWDTPIRNKAVKAYLMADSQKELALVQDTDFIKISVPAEAPDTLLSIVALEFEVKPDVLPIPTAGATATVSSVNPEKPYSNLFDGDFKNRWESVAGEKESWIEVDLGKPTPIENITLREPWGPRDNHGQEFQLLVKNGNKWEKIIEGKTRGNGLNQSFEPVTGQFFRLNIKGSNGEAPVLNEWILNRAI